MTVGLGGGKIIYAELHAGPEIAEVAQMDPRALPYAWRTMMCAPSRQPPQHARADSALYHHMTHRPNPVYGY